MDTKILSDRNIHNIHFMIPFLSRIREYLIEVQADEGSVFDAIRIQGGIEFLLKRAGLEIKDEQEKPTTSLGKAVFALEKSLKESWND